MTKPANDKPPDLIEHVLSQFDQRKDVFEVFAAKTKTLIEEALQAAAIRYQSVQARVKSRNKLRRKYLDPKKRYSTLDDVTDLVAFRVVLYYEDEIDRVADLVKNEFIVDLERSVDKRSTEPDRFGYYALNYICAYLARRTSNFEYKTFEGLWCEIQITSVLRHAWSEIEHEWYDLKENYPAEIKRRFYRIAALLEIAESEFLSLRNSKAGYERSVAVQVEARVTDVPVDAVSLKTFVLQEPAARIDESIAAIASLTLADAGESTLEILATLASIAGLKTIKELSDALEEYEEPLGRYYRRYQPLVQDKQERNQVSRGTSIAHLSILLLSRQGLDAVVAAVTKALNTGPTWNVAAQVAIARDVLESINLED